MVKKKVDVNIELADIKNDLKDIKSYIYNMRMNSSMRARKHYSRYQDIIRWSGWVFLAVFILIYIHHFS
jgi:hypothetical protein